MLYKTVQEAAAAAVARNPALKNVYTALEARFVRIEQYVKDHLDYGKIFKEEAGRLAGVVGKSQRVAAEVARANGGVVADAVVPGSRGSVIDAVKLRTHLSLQQEGVLCTQGKLTPMAIRKSVKIDLADKVIRNPAIVRVLTKDGSAIADWGKFKTESVRLPNGQSVQIHYYKNTKTGKIDYETADYKVVTGIVP